MALKEVKGWGEGDIEDRREMYMLAQRICKEEGLSEQMTKDLLATIYAESGWNQRCENYKNQNGTTDFGLCQFNTGKNSKGIPFWIGDGAVFESIDEVLNKPDKCIRVMAGEFKRGNAKWWVAYTSGKYKQYLNKTITFAGKVNNYKFNT